MYRALPNGSVDPIQLYVDEEARECFYSLAWTIDLRTGAALLLMAGECGVIKVLDTHSRRVVRRLVGHGSSVNELRVHPLDLNVLLSASKDMSLRVWNAASGLCVAIFAGEGGHRDEVLSADWHPDGEALVSSGMDHSVMTWALGPDVKRAMRDAYLPSSSRPLHRPFRPALVQFPASSSNRVHGNYVDHVRFLGDAVLSKSTDEKVVLWCMRKQGNKQVSHHTHTRTHRHRDTETSQR